MIEPKEYNATCRDQIGSYIDAINTAKSRRQKYAFNLNGPGLFIRSKLLGWYLFRGPNGGKKNER